MNMPPVKIDYFPLRGGLNQVSPPLSIADGFVRDSLNFEADSDGGYSLTTGYERYDGRPEPSSAFYYVLTCNITGAIAVGNTITGNTSGATGKVLLVGAGFIVITKLTGSFVNSELLKVATVTVATSLGIETRGGASTVILDAQYSALAADEYRADITAVTGSGSILGVWRYNNVVYAFRNNVGNTATNMYKSTASGWSLVDLGYEVNFSNANTSVNDGDTLTQGGVTAIIKRVVVETGSLLSGTNTGKLVLLTPSGGSFAAGAATSTGGGSLTLSGASAAITMPPNGSYEFVNYNFGGASNTLRMYGTYGTGRCFEFDGSVYVPIKTGLANDKPSHIAVHVNKLFVSYDSSALYTPAGLPYCFDGVLGAGEIASGDKINGLIPMIGSDSSAALSILCTNTTYILYGKSADTFNLVVLSYESGAYVGGSQSFGQLYVMDERGVRQLAASQNFGNFSSVQITKLVKPFLRDRIGKTLCSTTSRLRNQIRYYFSDKMALYVTFDNDKVVGIMPLKMAHAFNCLCSLESGDGDEYILAGGTDGFVYRLQKGTSFDGQNISASLLLSFNHSNSPRGRKRYRKAVYEITGTAYAEMQASYELGYGSPDIAQGIQQSLNTPLSGTSWDSFIWDSFYWDGKTLLPTEQDLTGTAENISLVNRVNSNFTKPFTINSVILHYTDRRQLR